MFYPDDIERMTSLAEHMNRWLLGWVHRHRH